MAVSAIQQIVPEHDRISTRYEFRAQVIGSLLVRCPDCGTVFKKRINWNTWKVRCTYKNCRAGIVIGIHAGMIRAMGRLKRKPARPIDTIMPTGPVIRWRSGEPIHRLSIESE